MAMRRGPGKSSRDDEGGIVRARADRRFVCFTESSTEVRAPQVCLAIGSGAVQQNVRNAERCRIKRLVNGVAGAGMIELEAQQLPGRQAMPGATQRHARGRVRSQVNSHGSGFNCGRRASQASNSGAGLRPSTDRRYSASWKLVLW